MENEVMVGHTLKASEIYVVHCNPPKAVWQK